MDTQASPVHSRKLQLDGLRAIAFCMVTIAHSGVLNFRWLSLGQAGVGIFFTLSGMLITGILLQVRSEAEKSGSSKFSVLRQFCVRRLLRLVPLLAVVLGISMMINLRPVTETWPWHVFYLSNIYQFLYGWDGYGSNLWTLSIEEQYYLCWPLIVLFLPRPAIVRILVICLCVPIPIRYLVANLVQNGPSRVGDPNLLPVAQLDCLAIGGLLACAQKGLLSSDPRKLASRVTLAAFTVWVALAFFPGLEYVRETAQALMWMAVVERCSTGISGPAGKVLSSAPLVYVGKISYGAYVLQGFVLGWWLWFLYECPIPGYRIANRIGVKEGVLTSAEFQSCVWLAANLFIACLLWHCVEEPINSLKRFFPYIAKNQARRSEAVG